MEHQCRQLIRTRKRKRSTNFFLFFFFFFLSQQLLLCWPNFLPFLFSSQFSARISIFQGITADDVSFICHKHFYVLAIDIVCMFHNTNTPTTTSTEPSPSFFFFWGKNHGNLVIDKSKDELHTNIRSLETDISEKFNKISSTATHDQDVIIPIIWS